MSRYLSRVVSLLINEHFGSPAQQVIEAIDSKGQCTIYEIIQQSKLEKQLVKQTLCILIRHEFVEFTEENKSTLYKVLHNNAYLITRYPTFINVAKEKLGELAEVLVLELIALGHTTIEEIVTLILKKHATMEKMDLEQLRETFVGLVDKGYIRKVQHISPELLEDLEEMEESRARGDFIGAKRSAMSVDVIESKRLKLEDARLKQTSLLNEAGLWYLNFDRFHDIIMDKYILQFIEHKYTPITVTLLDTMLNLECYDKTDVDSKLPVQPKMIHVTEIMKYVPDDIYISQNQVEEYLKLLCTNSDRIMKMGNEIGEFTFDYKACLQLLVQNTINSIIEERYGPKALRIFNNLIRKKLIEVAQIADITLIPPQELHQLLAALYKENIIQLQEIPKGTDYFPNRVIYLYYVNLQQLNKILLDRSYQILGNMISKRVTVEEESKRVLEKEERVYRQLLQVQAQTNNSELIEEIEQQLTSGEKDQASKSRSMLQRLQASESFIDQTIFLLSRFNHF